MRLDQWVKQAGRGELARIMRVTGLAYQTVHAIVHGRRASYLSAERISQATDGAVTVAELCERPVTAEPAAPITRRRAPVRKRESTPRRGRKAARKVARKAPRRKKARRVRR